MARRGPGVTRRPERHPEIGLDTQSGRTAEEDLDVRYPRGDGARRLGRRGEELHHSFRSVDRETRRERRSRQGDRQGRVVHDDGLGELDGQQ